MGKKPSWKKTNVPWELDTQIWYQMALGSSDTQIETLLQLGSEALDRNTIHEVRIELQLLPEELARGLSPEVQTYWRDLRQRAGLPITSEVVSAIDQVKEDLRRRHLERLFGKVDELRLCFRDMASLSANDTGDYGMEIDGQDWSLDPIIWDSLSTPDLEDVHWSNTESLLLNAHMKKSKFWEDYRQLQEMAETLEKCYEKAADKLAKDDQRFRQTWTTVQLRKKRQLESRPSRTRNNPEVDYSRYKPSCDKKTSDELVKKMVKIVPDIHNQQISLIQQLLKLHDDLLPGVVEKIITDGYCDQCP
jgi:hypothetical protein